ncbi:MAG: hypothetical protein U0V74_12735 [Chitinophagales bacterium]
MKKVLLNSLLAVALIVGISSCSKDPLVVPYDLGTKGPMCIPASPAVYGLSSYEYTVTKAQIEAALTAANISDPWSRLEEVKVEGLKVEVAASSGATNLNDIEGAQVYAKNVGTAGKGTQIAYSPTITSGSAVVELSLNGSDIKELVKAGDIVITVDATTKAPGNANAICLNLTSGKLAMKIKQ